MFLKNRNISSKNKRSKVTDCAALSKRIDHELDKNTPNAARVGHELIYICFLTIVLKKAHPCFGGISSKMDVPRIAAVELFL